MPSTVPADRPSQLVEGLPRALLRMMEETDSESIHSGVAPSHWAAAATYVHDYIMMRDTRQVDIADRFGCGAATISRLYPRVVASKAMDIIYGKTLPLPGSIASMLSERRATVYMVATRLGESRNLARVRVRSAEHNSNVQSEPFASKRFYWCDEPN